MLSKQLSEKTAKKLYLEIPEFEDFAIEHLGKGSTTGYLVLDYFGSFVKDLIIENASQELIDRCYSFINRLSEIEDKNIEEWLKVTFLESMIDKGKPREISRLKFKGRALIFFEEIISHPFFWRR